MSSDSTYISPSKVRPRDAARIAGEKTFVGTSCSKCSGTIRSVANGGCIPCGRAATARFKARNRSEMNAQCRKWYQENKERSQATTRLWTANNSQRVREVSAIWRANNLEQYKDVAREWRMKNHQRRAALQNNRRAREISAPGKFTLQDVQAILIAQNFHCSYCNATSKLHIDHVIPLSRGGTNWPWNLQWLCAHHNSSKGAKTDAEYRRIAGLPAIERHLSLRMWLAVFAI